MTKECICGQCGPTRNKTIKLSGKRTSTIYLENPKRRTANRFVVDGCRVTVGRRCDWLVCVHDETGTEEIFVELKGADLRGAVEQLATTLKKFRCDERAEVPLCIVALTRNPLAGTDVALLKKRFKDHYKAELKTLRDGGSLPL